MTDSDLHALLDSPYAHERLAAFDELTRRRRERDEAARCECGHASVDHVERVAGCHACKGCVGFRRGE